MSGSKVLRFATFSRRHGPILSAAGLLSAAVLVPAPAGAAVHPGHEAGLTFNRHVAPIVFSRCAPCHRPGQSAPFSLLSHGDVRKRGQQVAELVRSRQMPPWPPEPGYGEFENERRLTDDQIDIIERWVTAGMPEGTNDPAPPPPQWSAGWQLGEPDLVLRMSEPYSLAPEGRDDYRNFVLPVQLPAPRYVRAVEVRPDNRAIVHHAFVKIDPTSQSRLRDAEEPGPGFSGMETAARMPGGHFLTYQPGRIVSEIAAGLAWRLDPHADVVLQTHLTPTGKPELLRAEVGLYFTEEAPTNLCFKLMLTSWVIDIPPGRTDYAVEDDYSLPVDVQVLAVLPHAHYLAKEMHGYARLPDGTRKELLRINDWDFRWQGDYRYAEPVFLPRGTTLHMRFTYDNSEDNPDNPHHPPRRVAYGANSTDEMAELWYQVLPANPRDFGRLAQDYERKMRKLHRAYVEHLLRVNPSDARAHMLFGLILLSDQKQTDAARHLRKAIELKPDYDEPHYLLGVMLRMQRKYAEARAEFEAVLKLNPKHYKAHGNLGVMRMEQGDRAPAEFHLREALRLNPEDSLARDALNDLLRRP